MRQGWKKRLGPGRYSISLHEARKEGSSHLKNIRRETVDDQFL